MFTQNFFKTLASQLMQVYNSKNFVADIKITGIDCNTGKTFDHCITVTEKDNEFVLFCESLGIRYSANYTAPETILDVQ
jgi:hypothetical protein